MINSCTFSGATVINYGNKTDSILNTLSTRLIEVNGNSNTERIMRETPPFYGVYQATVFAGRKSSQNSTVIQISLTNGKTEIPNTTYECTLFCDALGRIKSVQSNTKDTNFKMSPQIGYGRPNIPNSERGNTTSIFIFANYENPRTNYQIDINPVFVRETVEQNTLIVLVTIQVNNGYSNSVPNFTPRQAENLTLYRSSFADSCPQITINAVTDYYRGANLGQVLMTTSSVTSKQTSKTFSRYPLDFEKYLIEEGCGLTIKAINISEKINRPDVSYYTVLDSLLAYGLLRYFLWKLIKGKFCLLIVLHKYDNLFYYVLAHSEYACFESTFQLPAFVEAAKYFKYSL